MDFRDYTWTETQSGRLITTKLRKLDESFHFNFVFLTQNLQLFFKFGISKTQIAQNYPCSSQLMILETRCSQKITQGKPTTQKQKVTFFNFEFLT